MYLAERQTFITLPNSRSIICMHVFVEMTSLCSGSFVNMKSCNVRKNIFSIKYTVSTVCYKHE